MDYDFYAHSSRQRSEGFPACALILTVVDRSVYFVLALEISFAQ